MVVDDKETKLPARFENAVFKLDEMCERDNFGACFVYVCGDGRPTINKFNDDGSTTVLSLFNGEWHELLDVRS